MTREPLDPLVRGSSEHYDDPVYYDHTYRRRREDVEFYRNFAREHGGPVLELGVVRGRVAVPMAQDGHEITLLDASVPMLRKARERAKEDLSPEAQKRFRAVRGSLCTFRLGKRFGLITAPFNVLLHLYEPNEFAQCFQRVKQHLKRDGLFVFDVRMPQWVELTRDPNKWYKARPFVHPKLGCKVQYAERFEYDPLKQVLYVTMKFRPEGSTKTKGPKAFTSLLTHRQIFPNELRALLQLGGLRLVARYGDFSRTPFGPEAQEQIIVAAAI